MSPEIRSSPVINKIRALPDLRVQPNHVANMQVLEKWPGEKDDGQPAGSLHRNHRGLDVLLIVARYILITHPDSRSIETDSNPILELAWKDMESSEYKANIEAIKGEIIDLMASGGRVPDASFASLCESPTMLETFWKEPTFLLCVPLEILCEKTEEVEEEWVPPEMIGLGFLSTLSLITWNGELDLVEQINQIWYPRRCRDGTLLRLTRPETMPACIRVLYQAPPECQRSEKDLLRFALPNDQCYTLLAAVWLRSDNTTPDDDGDNLDFVHIYSPDAADVLPVVASKCMARSPETIGQGGHSYMLFYGRYNASDIKEELSPQSFAADLPKQNSFSQNPIGQNPFDQSMRGENALTRGSFGRGSTPRRAGVSIEGTSVKLETDSSSSTRGSFRGDFRGSFRGSSRGNPRGSSRGMSQDSPRGSSRGIPRGYSRGNPRGSFRGRGI